MIKIVKNLEPRPTPRPTVTRSGISFYPKKYKDYRAVWSKEFSKYDRIPADVGVKIRIKAEYQSPKTLKGRKYPFPKHDVDNVAKAILDSANKVLFHDDTQVVEIRVTKEYSLQDRVTVWVDF